jgi:hypothetical protein
LSLCLSRKVIVIYATSFCVNWAFPIARGTRLKHEHSEGFKASRAIRKAQFTQKGVAYKILLFETTSLKLPNLLNIFSHLLLTVLTNFSRPVENFHCSARRPAGFSTQLSRTLPVHSSSFSRPHHLVEAPPGEARPGGKRHLFSQKPGRSSSSHTLGPTEPRLDLKNRKRGVTSPARHRTLRGAGTGQTAPVHHRTEINVVLSFQNLYLSPFRAPIWTPDLCLWPARPSGSFGS